MERSEGEIFQKQPFPHFWSPSRNKFDQAGREKHL